MQLGIFLKMVLMLEGFATLIQLTPPGFFGKERKGKRKIVLDFYIIEKGNTKRMIDIKKRIRIERKGEKKERTWEDKIEFDIFS